MLRNTRFLAILAVVCLIAGIFATGAQAAKKSPYVIGAVFDITGPGAPLGTPERDTAVMVVNQINKTGGVNGHPIKLVVADNGSEETSCVRAVKKLIEADKAKAIIGPSSTGTTLAVANICQKAGIPLISCAAGMKITQPVKPFVFKTAQSDVYAVANVIDYLKKKHISKVAFINDSNAFGVSGKQQMDQQSKKAKIQVIAWESFNSKDTDMTAQLTKIKSMKPQAVICWGTNPAPAILARNMKQLDMKMPLIMSHGISNHKFIELAGPAANGVIFPSGRIIVASAIPSSDPQKKVLLKYNALFKGAYHREADHFGGHAYDAINLVIDAMRKVGDNPAKVRAEIEKRKRFVGIGGVFNFTPADHNGLGKSSFVMIQIKNGKWTLIR